jgi:hypothetical protein
MCLFHKSQQGRGAEGQNPDYIFSISDVWILVNTKDFLFEYNHLKSLLNSNGYQYVA